MWHQPARSEIIGKIQLNNLAAKGLIISSLTSYSMPFCYSWLFNCNDFTCLISSSFWPKNYIYFVAYHIACTCTSICNDLYATIDPSIHLNDGPASALGPHLGQLSGFCWCHYRSTCRSWLQTDKKYTIIVPDASLISCLKGRGPDVVVKATARHARVRGSHPVGAVLFELVKLFISLPIYRT